MKGDISALQRAQAKWADATFPGQPVGAVLKHLEKEVKELQEEPGNLAEQADVLLLFLDVNRKTGHTFETVLRAAWEKLEINKRRIWGPPDADGVREHVRQDT